MTEEMFNDVSQAIKPKKKIGIWDDRNRILGMFSVYEIPAPTLAKTPRVGFGDHLQTCRGCPGQSGEVHPRMHALFVFVKLGGKLYTVSWPTWAEF